MTELGFSCISSRFQSWCRFPLTTRILSTNRLMLVNNAHDASPQKRSDSKTLTAFLLTLAMFMESFHPCYLSNVKQDK